MSEQCRIWNSSVFRRTVPFSEQFRFAPFCAIDRVPVRRSISGDFLNHPAANLALGMATLLSCSNSEHRRTLAKLAQKSPKPLCFRMFRAFLPEFDFRTRSYTLCSISEPEKCSTGSIFELDGFDFRTPLFFFTCCFLRPSSWSFSRPSTSAFSASRTDSNRR